VVAVRHWSVDSLLSSSVTMIGISDPAACNYDMCSKTSDILGAVTVWLMQSCSGDTVPAAQMVQDRRETGPGTTLRIPGLHRAYRCAVVIIRPRSRKGCRFSVFKRSVSAAVVQTTGLSGVSSEERLK
jgi:hypothetical protein